jgi:3-phosphoshikimate 1-carboxyvinyltransferase
MKVIQLTAPQQINTDILLPPSKSICNRALIMHALTDSTEVLQNLSDCDDTRVMVEALRDMPETIDIGAAGTAMRFLTAYLSVRPGEHILTGSERMKHRPIYPLVDALRTLGARISYVEKEGFPPLHIYGQTLTGDEITIEGNISSQYISALLLIAPTLKNGLILHLQNDIISLPYINLTLSLMKDFGTDACWLDKHTISVKPCPYKGLSFKIENDWSAASYWYEISALCKDSHIRLKGLQQHSYQGDSRIARVFESLGVKTAYEHGDIILTKSVRKTNCFKDNFSDIPDLAQTVVVTCALLNIPFNIEGLQTLRIKETNRVEALKIELKKLGYFLHESANGTGLCWEGERCQPENNPSIATYDDHRMAMSFAPACLLYPSLTIQNPEVVNKSYVNFWKDLATAGFRLTIK